MHFVHFEYKINISLLMELDNYRLRFALNSFLGCRTRVVPSTCPCFGQNFKATSLVPLCSNAGLHSVKIGLVKGASKAVEWRGDSKVLRVFILGVQALGKHIKVSISALKLDRIFILFCWVCGRCQHLKLPLWTVRKLLQVVSDILLISNFNCTSSVFLGVVLKCKSTKISKAT